MVRQGWQRQTITAQSSRQSTRFPHLINADKIFGTHRSATNIPSPCRITNIDPNDVMILPHDAKSTPDGIFGNDTKGQKTSLVMMRRFDLSRPIPDRMKFSERTGQSALHHNPYP